MKRFGGIERIYCKLIPLRTHVFRDYLSWNGMMCLCGRKVRDGRGCEIWWAWLKGWRRVGMLEGRWVRCMEREGY